MAKIVAENGIGGSVKRDKKPRVSLQIKSQEEIAEKCEVHAG